MTGQGEHTGTVFQSRLARRIFLNFIASATVPLVVVAAIAFYHVTHEMGRQARSMLDREVESMANGLTERLLLHQARMGLLTASQGHRPRPGADAPSSAAAGDAQRWFKAAATVDPGGKVRPIFGRMASLPPVLDPGRQVHLDAGKMLILPPADGTGAGLQFARRLPSESAGNHWLWVEADSDRLWREGLEKQLPGGVRVCVFDRQGRTIYSSFAVPASLHQVVRSGGRQKDGGHFDHPIGGEAHYASFRSVSPRNLFPADQWTVVMVQQKYELSRTIEKFKQVFPLVIVVTLGVVVLLSINLIRGSLVPLKNLIQGTRRIARKDFSGRIDVASHDEFNELALSFNHMSSQLDQQFRALSASAEIDNAILSNLDQDKIVTAIVRGIRKVIACDRIGIAILDTDATDRMKIYRPADGRSGQTEIGAAWETIHHKEVERHFSGDAWVVSYEGRRRPRFLSSFENPDIGYQAVVPVKIEQALAGFIVLGYVRYEPGCNEHVAHAIRLADQMAVALANARLVTELNRSHWGSLNALSRAVDAKSPWTTGHAKRVARAAVMIGRALGLDDAALDRLHRGGLLHDVGKIGVPAVILDRPGNLSDTEYAAVKEHPSIGARILEPIAAFSDVVPIVAQHHERFDGRGYPLGLKGEAIDLGARILSVADAFDALLSNRPYREGWPIEKVIAMIEEGAGAQFDPRIVNVLVALMSQPAPDGAADGHGAVQDGRSHLWEDENPAAA